MFATILTAVLILLGLAAIVIGPKLVFDQGTSYENSPPKAVTRSVGAVLFLIAAVILGLSTTAIVQAKQEGVLVTFGKPSDRTLDPGLNFKLPWQKVVAVDTTKQVDNWNGGKNDHSVIKVLLGNGNQAEAYASVTWGIKKGEANNAYADYRGDNPLDTVYSRVIEPKIKASLQVVGGAYNPNKDILAVLAAQKAGKTDVGALGDVKIAPNLDELTELVKSDFLERVAIYDVVEIYDVQVSFIEFDEATRNDIRGFQAEVQKTINALQGVQTAEQIAKQNQILAASVSKNPDGLAAQCFKMIQEGKFTPPIGFSCYPPVAGSGSGTPGVIVNSAR